MPKKVLIVEDNELNMKLFADLLEAHGYETRQTREGLKAIGIARSFNPDLILMDIQLPEVSGLEVTKWIKDDKALADIPVVAVTAIAMKGDEKRIRDGDVRLISLSRLLLPHFLKRFVSSSKLLKGRFRCPPVSSSLMILRLISIF